VVVQVVDIPLGAGEEIVGAQHFMAEIEQAVDEMRAEEAGTAGDKYSLATFVDATH
jgi:hypothetical protein